MKLFIIIFLSFFFFSCKECPQLPLPVTAEEYLDECLSRSHMDNWGTPTPEKQLICYQVYEKAVEIRKQKQK